MKTNKYLIIAHTYPTAWTIHIACTWHKWSDRKTLYILVYRFRTYSAFALNVLNEHSLTPSKKGRETLNKMVQKNEKTNSLDGSHQLTFNNQ